MYHQAVFRAKRDLDSWAAQHLPSLADDANSGDAGGMVLTLSRLVRLAQIQLSAMQEQWTQDQHTDYQV